jgi:hypothetical protein
MFKVALTVELLDLGTKARSLEPSRLSARNMRGRSGRGSSPMKLTVKQKAELDRLDAAGRSIQ